MFGLGPTELIIIFLVILLVFGAKRIPEIARGMGKGIREFQNSLKDVKKEIDVRSAVEDTQESSNERSEEAQKDEGNKVEKKE